ncbi:MAG: hypothetical protein EZS28_029850 [Streblomastix strix]|uniref:Uncharacterized protein n=1 Tax=Streblomastix strix TaxID=222440 RepID=A0A5J4UWL3_9EUKA|nr:MAG: hypothetical protein EZS28_029850 [Streblomastix strix]
MDMSFLQDNQKKKEKEDQKEKEKIKEKEKEENKTNETSKLGKIVTDPEKQQQMRLQTFVLLHQISKEDKRLRKGEIKEQKRQLKRKNKRAKRLGRSMLQQIQKIAYKESNKQNRVQQDEKDKEKEQKRSNRQKIVDELEKIIKKQAHLRIKKNTLLAQKKRRIQQLSILERVFKSKANSDIAQDSIYLKEQMNSLSNKIQGCQYSIDYIKNNMQKQQKRQFVLLDKINAFKKSKKHKNIKAKDGQKESDIEQQTDSQSRSRRESNSQSQINEQSSNVRVQMQQYRKGNKQNSDSNQIRANKLQQQLLLQASQHPQQSSSQSGSNNNPQNNSSTLTSQQSQQLSLINQQLRHDRDSSQEDEPRRRDRQLENDEGNEANENEINSYNSSVNTNSISEERERGSFIQDENIQFAQNIVQSKSQLKLLKQQLKLQQHLYESKTKPSFQILPNINQPKQKALKQQQQNRLQNIQLQNNQIQQEQNTIDMEENEYFKMSEKLLTKPPPEYQFNKQDEEELYFDEQTGTWIAGKSEMDKLKDGSQLEDPDKILNEGIEIERERQRKMRANQNRKWKQFYKQQEKKEQKKDEIAEDLIDYYNEIGLSDEGQKANEKADEDKQEIQKLKQLMLIQKQQQQSQKNNHNNGKISQAKTEEELRRENIIMRQKDDEKYTSFYESLHLFQSEQENEQQQADTVIKQQKNEQVKETPQFTQYKILASNFFSYYNYY